MPKSNIVILHINHDCIKVIDMFVSDESLAKEKMLLMQVNPLRLYFVSER